MKKHHFFLNTGYDEKRKWPIKENNENSSYCSFSNQQNEQMKRYPSRKSTKINEANDRILEVTANPPTPAEIETQSILVSINELLHSRCEEPSPKPQPDMHEGFSFFPLSQQSTSALGSNANSEKKTASLSPRSDLVDVQTKVTGKNIILPPKKRKWNRDTFLWLHFCKEVQQSSCEKVKSVPSSSTNTPSLAHSVSRENASVSSIHIPESSEDNSLNSSQDASFNSQVSSLAETFSSEEEYESSSEESNMSEEDSEEEEYLEGEKEKPIYRTKYKRRRTTLVSVPSKCQKKNCALCSEGSNFNSSYSWREITVRLFQYLEKDNKGYYRQNQFFVCVNEEFFDYLQTHWEIISGGRDCKKFFLLISNFSIFIKIQ